MDSHVLEYYQAYSDDASPGHFHRVIPLHEDRLIEWEEALEWVPNLCRGWYELSHLSVQDRIEFTREFWRATLPYHPELSVFLDQFFASVDDIGIYLTQRTFDDPFCAHLIYSLSDNSGFFQGELPATEEEILALQNAFPAYILPADYLAFLRIHNGFAKAMDSGLIRSHDLPQVYADCQASLQEDPPVTTSLGTAVNSAGIIPFYRSFDMPFFQCFWSEWYPEQEMGNVYYSGLTRSLSDPAQANDSSETMAFKSFIDWLIFYLEKVD